MNKLFALIVLAALPAFAQQYIGIYGNEANGAVLPLSVEARIAAGESAASVAEEAADLAESATVAAAQVSAVQSNLTAHATDTNNPHQVTPAQIGAATGTPLYVETYQGTITGATIATGAAPAVVTNGGVLGITVPAGGSGNVDTSGLVSTSHVGNVSISGTISANASGFTPIVGRERFVPAFNSASGGVYVASPSRALTATATSAPAASLIGYDLREFGRACLWLNSYSYVGEGTNYDNQADVYFGVSNSFTDNDIRWTISSRPSIPRWWGHDTDGEFAVFEGYASGDPSIGGKRFAIYPDKNGNHGSVLFANDDNPYADMPISNSTINVRSTVRDASLYIETSTNANTLLKSRLHFKGGTNDLAMWMTGSNGYFAVTMNGLANEPIMSISNGVVRIRSFVLGTNAAVSDFPESGIDASAATGIAQAVVANYTNALPLPGCAILQIDPATSNAWLGATGLYGFYTVTNNTPWNLCISNDVYRSPYGYGIKVVSTQAITAGTNFVRVGAAPTALTGTNLVAVWPHEDPAKWNYKIQPQ